MSYQVLARKWRPHDFSSLLGQDHVVRALTHALTENRLHHAYLFTGTRGVGKTTISRILAKCLNCVGPDGKGGITAEPCGVCEACRAIDEDRFVDYIEMDAASTRGIDDMVSLLERAKYVPTNARFKVYMIDEVHQLTSAAFNAMLKTLEEPPEYVKFILATTDPQKVPVTVLSRCLQFNLKSLSPQLISSHMAELLEKEQISFEKPALRMLASGARGSMRDGLSLLDQAIAYSAGNVTLESVREMLGTIDSTTLIRLLGALANHEPKEIMKVADEIGARSLSYTQAMKDLAVLLHRIAMAQQLPELVGTLSSQREARAEELSRVEGMVNIHPYADPYVAAGLGTIGLEIVADLPDAAAVAVPIGGGGLISGVATAVKGLAPNIRTIGVEPAGAPRYGKSRAAGEPVALEKVETIADGTRTDHANPDNFQMIQARVDDLCAVDDAHIRQAIRLLMDKAKLTVEPSGTLPVAAALAGALPVKPEDKVVFVLSGGNLDPALAAQLLQE